MGNLKNKVNELKSEFNDWLYDHHKTKASIGYVLAILLSTISALTFAVGFNTFMDLGVAVGAGNIQYQKILSGGMSGLSQVITLICELCGWKTVAEGGTLDEHTAYAILYFVLNVPLLFVAWFGIGKRFSIMTLVNVIETSIFIRIFTVTNIPFLKLIADFTVENGGMLSRALFGGVCTGLSSALAYKGDFSAGGVDIIAYYIGLKKKTLVGSYAVVLNGATLLVFILLSITKAGWDDANTAASYVVGAFYTAIYLFVTKLVVDAINTRNKKVNVEVITSKEALGDVLIESFPHAATKLQGKGVYSGKDKFVFIMVISSDELNAVMRLIQREDNESFVEVMPLTSVAGRFFTKPIK